MTMSNTQSARISASAAGASGTAENARAAALAAAETGSPSPAQAFRLGCEAVRVHSQIEPRRRVENPGWVEAGRPAGAIAPQRQQVRGGPERVADGEAQVAQRGFVGVDAQDLGGGRGALQRQAGAQRPGGGRVGAQERRREARVRRRRRTADRPALPFRSPAPRPGSAPAAETLAVPGFSPRSALLARGCRSGAGTRSRVWSAARRAAGDSARITGHGESSAALCHLFVRVIRPACRGLAMSDKLALSDIRRVNHGNGNGLSPLLPKAPADLEQTAEASENVRGRLTAVARPSPMALRDRPRRSARDETRRPPVPAGRPAPHRGLRRSSRSRSASARSAWRHGPGSRRQATSG